ncbi:MAG: hypothetical protein HY551_04035 [Elusimicrobia bacterium]|nr:hypothetical protein [Elusimicrobiota bacterium]
MIQNKRQKLWIDTQAQLIWLAIVLVLVAASLATAYLSIARGLEQMSFQTGRIFFSIDDALHAIQRPFLVASAVVLSAAAFLSILWSHRVIGPLMVLTAGIRRIRSGYLDGEWRARKSDLLSGTVRDLTEMQTALRKAADEDRRRLAQAQKELEALGEDLRKAKAPARAGERVKKIQEQLGEIGGFFKQ